ncbi:TetR/AcrR family transcriptional regulator [Pollutimonas bauzanensis]|jgi:AcrR family transcriptional regulator|uniref:TetR/AcrR family transcriptional regulator n=1 Tax=Pollutimonas bauzanensis TaxID=658167 RepID=UPI00333FB54C
MTVPKSRGRPSAKLRILDATLDVIKDLGTDRLTLDLVAERAGVSKGGLLYHFRFKEDLLKAANAHLVQRRYIARALEAKKLRPTRCRDLKAYVLASANNRADNDGISTKMLAAGSMVDESAEPIRQYFQERFPPFVEVAGFDCAAVVHAATEGLWFMEMLGLSPFPPEQRERLIKKLLSMVDEVDSDIVG